jgi:hypothetical protein
MNLGTFENLLTCLWYTFPSRGSFPNRCHGNLPPLPDYTAELVKEDHHRWYDVVAFINQGNYPS